MVVEPDVPPSPKRPPAAGALDVAVPAAGAAVGAGVAPKLLNNEAGVVAGIVEEVGAAK